MSKLFDWKVLRASTEETFQGLFFVATTVFVLGVTIAMCL